MRINSLLILLVLACTSVITPLLCAHAEEDEVPWSDIEGYEQYRLHALKSELDLSAFTASDNDLLPYGYPAKYSLTENGRRIEIITGLDHINLATRFNEGSECALQLTFVNGVLEHIMIKSLFITEGRTDFPMDEMRDFCDQMVDVLFSKYGEQGVREATFQDNHVYVIWEDYDGDELLFEEVAGQETALYIQYSTAEFWNQLEEDTKAASEDSKSKF